MKFNFNQMRGALKKVLVGVGFNSVNKRWQDWSLDLLEPKQNLEGKVMIGIRMSDLSWPIIDTHICK